MPAVLILHGYNEDIEFIREYTMMNDVADSSGFIAVYPASIPPGWNVEYDHPDLPLSDVDDAGFISALIDILEAKYDIDPVRVYACGFSNGGDMAFRLALFLRHRFAAVAGVSAVLTEKTAAAAGAGAVPTVTGTIKSTAANAVIQEPCPVLMIHGTKDILVPFSSASYNSFTVKETLDFWIDATSCRGLGDAPTLSGPITIPDSDPNDGCTAEKYVYENSTGEARVVFYKIIGGGHSWPGGCCGYPWADPTNRDINAGIEIWDFFKRFEREY